MKLLLLSLVALMLAGCTTRTDLGPCVGLNDSDRNPTLIYKPSTKNIVLAVIFAETVVVPAIVATSELYCPTGVK